MASPPPFAAVPQRTASHRMDVGASRKGVFRLTLLMYGMRNRCRWGVTTSRPGVDAPFLLGLALLRHYGGHRDEAAEERHARADDPLQPGRPGRGLGAGTPPVSRGTAPSVPGPGGRARAGSPVPRGRSRPPRRAARPWRRRARCPPAPILSGRPQPSGQVGGDRHDERDGVERAFMRFRVLPPSLPHSGLERTTATLGLKAAFPKSVPPKQAARSWATRAAAESMLTGDPLS